MDTNTTSLTVSQPAAAVQSKYLFTNRVAFQRMLFPVHVYIHYTETHNYPDRVEQIMSKLTSPEPFFPFPVTCTVVLASASEPDADLLDVYVVGGHQRYRLGIVEEGHRLPTLVEVLDTIGWAALRGTEAEAALASLPRTPRSTVVLKTADASEAEAEGGEPNAFTITGLRQAISMARKNLGPVYDAGLVVVGPTVMYNR